MKNKIHIKNIGELFKEPGNHEDIRQFINCLPIDHKAILSRFASPVYVEALIAILVLSGNSQLNVNYKVYSVTKHSLILLSFSHLFCFKECSKDFSGLCLLVGKGFMKEMDSTDMIHKRIKYGVKLYNVPVLKMNSVHACCIAARIKEVEQAIDRREHYFYKELVLNSLFAFYLDLSDLIERFPEIHFTGNMTRYESVVGSFIELLSVHYREEHQVEFYAAKLNISAHYLTLIVKKVTGQSVSDFIFEMLYSEARSLLCQSRYSVQEISSLLNFSDQSSFGKFFKRKSGLSPVDFRKKS